MTDYKKLDLFQQQHNIRWYEPGLDYSVNTMGWWEDSEDNIIGQDWHLEDWIKNNFPEDYKEIYTQ